MLSVAAVSSISYFCMLFFTYKGSWSCRAYDDTKLIMDLALSSTIL